MRSAKPDHPEWLAVIALDDADYERLNLDVVDICQTNRARGSGP
jgi:hypothetical protein